MTDLPTPPLVSVVIPFFNASTTIRQCVDSVLRQTVRDVEILAVDNNSTDGGPDALRDLECQHLCVLHEPTPGPAAARNCGLDAARGTYVLFLDADVELPDPHWLERAISLLEAHHPQAIIGVSGVGQATSSDLVSDALNALLYGRSTTREYRTNHVATMVLMMRAADVHPQRFSTRLRCGEDPEFCFRYADRGWALLVHPALAVLHKHPVTLKGAISRWYRYGKFFALPYLLHPRQIRASVVARLAFAVALPVLAVAAVFSLSIALVVFFTAVLVLFAAYVFQLIRAGTPFPWVPPYAAIHCVKQLAQIFGILVSIPKWVQLRRYRPSQSMLAGIRSPERAAP